MRSINGRTFCEMFNPPPFPPPEFEGYVEIVDYALKDETFLAYADMCNVTLPRLPSSAPTTISSRRTSSTSLVTFTSTVQSTVTPKTVPETTSKTFTGSTRSSVYTTTSYVTSPPPLQTVATASPAFIIGIVLLVIFIIMLLVVLVWYCVKKRDKRGSVNINSLPLKSYENTNYLANKAQAGQCWNPSSDQSSGNQYGSFPPIIGNDKAQVMISAENGPGVEDELRNGNGSQRGSSYEKTETIGYVNENFNEMEEDRATSPGVDSQTPLFDMIDGVLPNAVPPNGTEMDESKSSLKDVLEVSTGNVDSQPSQSPPTDQPGNGEVVERRSKKRKKSRSKSAEVKAEKTEDLETRPKTVTT